jgi:hypothetical protein
MLEKNAYESAMRRALARKPFLKTDDRYYRVRRLILPPVFVDTNVLIYALDRRI